MSSLAHGRGITVNIERQRVAQRTLRIRRAWWRLALLLVAVMLIAALQSGCASPGGGVSEYNYESPSGKVVAAPGHSSHEQSTSPAASSHDRGGLGKDDVAPETKRLAEQSERDVALLLNGRSGNAGNGLTGAADSATNSNDAVAPAAQPRKPVVWNDLQRSKSGANDPTAGKAGGASAALASPSSPASQPAASQPDSSGLRPDRIRQLAVDLARELYAQGAYSDHPLRELSVIAAMNMVEPERRIDPAAIPDLTDEERQVLASLQTFFGDVGKTMEGGGGGAAGQLGEGVARAAGTLRQALVHEPHLKIPTVALCTRVGGFGDYTPFGHYTFLAGSEQKAIVYLEISDFVSEVNQKNEYVTELSQQLTLYSDRDGIPVWKEDWQPATDVTRNKRQDFFTVQVITLPKALSVGKYTLKVRVRDEKSKAESETSVPLEMVADAKMVK